MLLRFDPFRDLDRRAETTLRRSAVPMDAYREGDRYLVHLDLPGVDPDSIDLTVEKNALTISAQRSWSPGAEVELVAAERPHGTFTRQLFLGDALDTEAISADYVNGVLTIAIPVAETAKPRKIEVTGSGDQRVIDAKSSAA
jgi:HSP20 family protein